MPYNFAQLKAAIMDWGWDESAELEAALPQIIALAETRVIMDLDLQTARKRTTVIVDGVTGLGELPADVLAIRAVRIPETRVALIPSRESYMDLFTSEVGTPRYWCLTTPSLQTGPSAPRLEIAPVSGAVGEVEIVYTQSGPRLSDSNTVTWLSSNYDSLLLLACLVEVATRSDGTTTGDQFEHKTLEGRYQAALIAAKQIEQLGSGYIPDPARI